MKVLSREARALRLSAILRVERAEPADQPCGDGALGLIRRGAPEVVVEHRREAVAIVLVAFAVAHDGVQLALIVRIHPGSVVVLQLECRERVAACEARRARGEDALETEGSGRERD